MVKAPPPTMDELKTVKAWAARSAASESLHEFVRQAWGVVEPKQPFRDNWHIGAICDHLQAVTSGEIENLLLNVPPGTSKSTLVCVMWPTWEWATDPGLRQMFASYSAGYAVRDSMKCRRIVESEWYRRNWGPEAEDAWGELLEDGFRAVAIASDQNQKAKFETTQGGWRTAIGVGGSTGEHPDRIGIDDPHKINEAESEAERTAVVDWSDGVMSTRGLMRNVRRVGVMQRLHAGDWSGHVLGQGGWVHICLPMRYEAPERVQAPEGGWVLKPRMQPTPLGFQDPRKEDGELLWPSVYTVQVVDKLAAKLGLYHAAGQLQQRPAPRGGGTFQRAWFVVVEKAPACHRYVRYWDKAGTAGGTGARTATVLMGEFVDGTLPEKHPMRIKWCIMHAQGFREASAAREAIIKQTAATDLATYGYVETWVEQEPGSGGKESAENTVANLTGHSVRAERVTGAKEVRAEPMSAQASVGRVWVLSAPWTAELLDELEVFPMGKLKDMVDAAGGAFNKLHEPTGAFGSMEGLFTGKPEESDSSDWTPAPERTSDLFL